MKIQKQGFQAWKISQKTQKYKSFLHNKKFWVI